jgi:acetylglutamate kinase
MTMMTKPVVIKIGGNEIDDVTFLNQLAGVIGNMNTPVVIVHGGGKEISNMQKQLGIEPRYMDGVRVTDAASLAVVEMVLCGMVNKRLVRHLLAGGVDAQGMSGVDRGLVQAEKMPHATVDMQFTGKAGAVRGDALLDMLSQGITPVIAPVCLGDDCNYNVNADHVAGAIASAIGASRVIFLTNVEGVLYEESVVETLTPEQAEAYILNDVICGGMIPKVKTALGVLQKGVPQAVITNLHGVSTQGGTIFHQL